MENGLPLRLKHQAIRVWCGAGNPVKESGEVALMAEAGAKAHLDERHFAVSQERFGAVDAELDQILVRRRSGCSLELTRKMKGAHSGHARQFRETQVTPVIVGDEFRHQTQSLPGKAAGEALCIVAKGRVVPQQMNGQNVGQRFRVEVATDWARSSFA